MQGNPGQMVPGLQPDEPNSKGFEVLNTGQIYSKIAASGPFKKSAVRQICQQFMDMSFEQARHNGTFEMGSMMKIHVHEVPATTATQKRRGTSPKKKLTITPMVMMKRKILGRRFWHADGIWHRSA